MVNTIYQMGDDALNNQATFSLVPLPGMALTEPFKMRISSFSIPAYKIEFYSVSHKGFTVPRAKPGDSVTKDLSINFRADKYMSIYKMFRAWAKKIYDHENGDLGLGDVPEVRTSGIIEAPGLVAKISGLIIADVPELSYDQTSDGSVMDLAIAFHYLQCDVN